ncbi:PREDICTED: protein-arginine deiminase type-1-like [Ficedula albicollis]|uniref:protein-arginine deiminase type-1-like n=1 Tax=Ficedula albicollis TaxID=59894 RepID=UPI0007AD91DF|nr:PREDICTED: protein-arginine deiminase type-1-like [Ficedula albicollis]
MAPRHVVPMSTSRAARGVCVLGTEVFLDTRRSTPRGAASFDVHATPAVTVHVIHSPATKPSLDSRWPLDPDIEVVVTIDVTSRTVDDNQVKISYYDREGRELAVAWLYLTCVEVSLDVDWSRSGRVKSKGKDKVRAGPSPASSWKISRRDRDLGGVCVRASSPGRPQPTHRGGKGFIFLFHAKTSCGSSQALRILNLQDMSVMLLRTQGPSAVFAEYPVVLHVPESDADKVRVFHAVRGDAPPLYKPVLGPDKLSYVLERAGHGDSTFYVEGLAFPDRGFSGLVSFSASLLELPHKDSPGTPIFTDTVVFRVAPWIMTPNTQQPLEVFVCRLRLLLSKAGCKLTVCSEQDTRSDRWIQDELEFGYVEAPHKTFPVVFDSPRNRGLKDFAFKKILGPDFGYVTREPPGKSVSSLDSFGNLDVSPPVTVRGKEYPLGRILIGSPLPWASGRRMCRAVRDFLFAQKVQAPLEVYSEWLSVGHVDEFLTFVPALDRKGFRLLLASPNACYKLFKEKQQQGHGEATQFIGLKGAEKRSIDEILADESLRSDNRHVQRCIDWNRDLLKQELGLSEQDIVDIPQLFILTNSRADALFPDMEGISVSLRSLSPPDRNTSRCPPGTAWHRPGNRNPPSAPGTALRGPAALLGPDTLLWGNLLSWQHF